MKNWFTSKLLIVGMLGITLAISSCDKDDDAPEMLAYAPNEYVEARTMADWSVIWWQHVLNADCASNPLNDATGAFTGVNQNAPVYFLFGTSGGEAHRTATIPSGKPVFFPLVNSYWQNPCSTPVGDNPAQGQTMEDFLKSACDNYISKAGNLSCTLDGTAIPDLTARRVTSELFYYTGNIDLATCFDSCITGQSQPAVSDGYWVMLKPLSKGTHTLHFTGGFPEFTFLVDVTYTLTVQ